MSPDCRGSGAEAQQYSEDTATLLAKQLLDGATADTTIAVVSAPSVFVALKKLLLVSGSRQNSALPLFPTSSHTGGRPHIKARSPAQDAAEPPPPRPKLVLLEHDRRFSVFPEFVFYDFAQPLDLPAHLKGRADRLVCDPPFLSEDCQAKGQSGADRHRSQAQNART